MNTKDNANLSEFPRILPFQVENRKPQLSIKTEHADIGIFYKEYYSVVYRRCLSILGSVEDAEDSAHDVFAKLYELKTKGRLSISYPKTYLSKAAANMGINKKRARKEQNKIYDIATGENIARFMERGEQGREKLQSGITYNDYEQVEAEIIVNAILNEQDETTRRIYFYKYHDGMTLKQIGEVVGLGKSAVHKRIKALEEQVKSKMEKADK